MNCLHFCISSLRLITFLRHILMAGSNYHYHYFRMDPAAAHLRWVPPSPAATFLPHSATVGLDRQWEETEEGGREAQIAGAMRTPSASPTCQTMFQRLILPSSSVRSAMSLGSIWQWTAPLERVEDLHSSRSLTGMDVTDSPNFFQDMTMRAHFIYVM